MNASLRRLALFAFLLTATGFLHVSADEPRKSAASATETESADHQERSSKPGLNVGRGPLGIRNTFPIAIQHLSLGLETPATLLRGTGSFSVRSSWTNSFGFIRRTFRLDGEVVRTEAEIAYSCLQDVEFRLAAPHLHRGGGSMDPLIRTWHDTFSLPNHTNVGEFDENEGVFTLTDGQGHTFRRTETDSGLGNATASVKFTLSEGGDETPAFGAIVQIGVPTGERSKQLGGAGVDVGASLLLSKRIGDFYLYLNGGGTWFSDTRLGNGVEYEPVRPFGGLAIEYTLSERVSIVAQTSISGGLIEDVKLLNNVQGDLGVGLQWGVTPRTQIEFGIIEGLYTIDATPDFGFHAGVRFGF